MASNEKLYEEYGFKAAEKGVFIEWREKTSSILEQDPKMPRIEAAEKAYFELVGSKK
jgi:hypothetical protein